MKRQGYMFYGGYLRYHFFSDFPWLPRLPVFLHLQAPTMFSIPDKFYLISGVTKIAHAHGDAVCQKQS